jgi:hypothetical protein
MTFSYELGGALPAFCQKSPCKIFRIPISVNRRKTDDRLTAGVLDPKGFGVLDDLPGRREAAGLSSFRATHGFHCKGVTGREIASRPEEVETIPGSATRIWPPPVRISPARTSRTSTRAGDHYRCRALRPAYRASRAAFRSASKASS